MSSTPTIYEILDIPHPKVVHGYEQMPMDGVSLAYTFDDATAPTQKKHQFFDNNGSRAIYKDGWLACTFGALIPWNTPASVPCIKEWDSATDQWELYKLDEDFSQANDLAKVHPDKLEALKKDFLELAEDNKAFPIGAGLWLRTHPRTSVSRLMPEFNAPGVGRESTHVTVDLEMRDGASGVLYAVGGAFPHRRFEPHRPGNASHPDPHPVGRARSRGPGPVRSHRVQ